jgi:hypothetical protein
MVGIASLAVPASAGNPPADTVTVQCDSGIITQGDVQMSSLFVAKIPADALPAVPGGCVTR